MSGKAAFNGCEKLYHEAKCADLRDKIAGDKAKNRRNTWCISRFFHAVNDNFVRKDACCGDWYRF